jgi:hypothetical protein
VVSPAAYAKPSLESSWQAFWSHLPIMVVIGVLTTLLSGLGVLVMLLVQFLLGGGIATPDLSAAPSTSSAASSLATLSQLPFSLVSSYVGVLTTAVPALYYATGRVITIQEGFAELLRRPGRYFLAGLLFTAVTTLGLLLCVIPGLMLGLVLPVYVNLIFTTDRPIVDVFQASFQACFGTEAGRSFLFGQLLAWLVSIALTIATCLLGGLVAGPILAFYLQNLAYYWGVLR